MLELKGKQNYETDSEYCNSRQVINKMKNTAVPMPAVAYANEIVTSAVDKITVVLAEERIIHVLSDKWIAQ